MRGNANMPRELLMVWVKRRARCDTYDMGQGIIQSSSLSNALNVRDIDVCTGCCEVAETVLQLGYEESP